MENKKQLMKSSLMLGVNPNVKREENDFYATNPEALELFLSEQTFGIANNVWECACGEGHLSKKLEEWKFKVKSSDLINRGYGEVLDFLKFEGNWDGDILTNPPFKLADEFVKKGMSILKEGNKLILFLKVQFLESESRYKLFKKYPLKYMYIHSSRQQCCRNAEFEKYTATTQFYCWFVWEKGYVGETIIRWIKPDLTKLNNGNDGIPPKPKVLGILPNFI
jgi:hypothetical protein